MNTSFNTNRLWLLIKRYFVENKQRELTFWGISLVVFMLMRDSDSVLSYFIIAGYFLAANAYRIFGHTPGGMHYLLIPATQTEKLVSNIIINTFYYFAAFSITYVIGTFIGIHLENLIFGHDRQVYFNLFAYGDSTGENAKYLWYVFYAFAAVQAVALTGSLYFKRSAAMKTILTIFIVMFVLFLFEAFLLKMLFGTYELSGRNININPNEFDNIFPALKIIGKIIVYSILPFLWTVSYFRLSEKEV